MSDERLLELLSAGSDGELSVDEKKELDELLAGNDSAAATREAWTRMDTLLRSLPPAEPPAGLGERIVSRVRLPGAGEASTSTGWLRPLAIDRLWRYGFSAAFGALLAIAVYESQPDYTRPANITELVGTIAPDSELAGRDIIDTFTVDAGDIDSIARLENRNGWLVLDVRIDSAKPVDISIDFGAAGLGLEALAQPPNGLESIRLQDNVLRIVGSGQRRFSVLLHRPADAVPAGEAGLWIEVTSEGNLLKQGLLRLDR